MALRGWPVSGHGVLLPIPDALVLEWQESWRRAEAGEVMGWGRPGQRSDWLRAFEDVIGVYFPQSSSRDRSLTARHAAPFWLKDGPNVP